MSSNNIFMRQIGSVGGPRNRSDKLQEFRLKLEETFNNPDPIHEYKVKPFAIKAVDTPKLSHYNSLRSLCDSVEKSTKINRLHHRTSSNDFSSSRKNIQEMLSEKGLQDVLPLELLREANLAIRGNLKKLPAAYKAELRMFCKKITQKLK